MKGVMQTDVPELIMRLERIVFKERHIGLLKLENNRACALVGSVIWLFGMSIVEMMLKHSIMRLGSCEVTNFSISLP